MEGRRVRYDLLVRRGLTFPQEYSFKTLPTYDQLDAALSAYIAYLFKNKETSDYGKEPFEDTSEEVLREGFIVQPNSPGQMV